MQKTRCKTFTGFQAIICEDYANEWIKELEKEVAIAGHEIEIISSSSTHTSDRTSENNSYGGNTEALFHYYTICIWYKIIKAKN